MTFMIRLCFSIDQLIAEHCNFFYLESASELYLTQEMQPESMWIMSALVCWLFNEVLGQLSQSRKTVVSYCVARIFQEIPIWFQLKDLGDQSQNHFLGCWGWPRGKMDIWRSDAGHNGKWVGLWREGERNGMSGVGPRIVKCVGHMGRERGTARLQFRTRSKRQGSSAPKLCVNPVYRPGKYARQTRAG